MAHAPQREGSATILAMKKAPWLIVLLGLMASVHAAEPAAAPASGDPASVDANALALVRALQADQLTAAGIRYALAKDASNPLPKPIRDCLTAMDFSFAQGMYVDVVKKIMSPPELRDAAAFYQSRAGYMSIMVSLRGAREQLQDYPAMAEAEAAGEPTREEVRQIEAFEQSPLAKKLEQIHTGPEADKVMQAIVQRMWEQCVKQP